MDLLEKTIIHSKLRFNPHIAFRARTLLYVSISYLIVFPLALGIRHSLSPLTFAMITAGQVAEVLFFLPMVFLRTGFYFWGAVSFLSGVYVVVFFASVTLGGFKPPVIAFLIFLPLIVTSLLGLRVGLLQWILSSGGLLLIWLGRHFDWIHWRDVDPSTYDNITFSSYFFITILNEGLAYSYERNRSEAEAQVIQATELVNIGILAGGLSHEIRNPLAAISLHIGLVKKKGSDLASFKENIQPLLSKMEKDVERISTILEDLNYYAGGSETAVKEEFSLSEVVYEVIKERRSRLESKGVKYDLQEHFSQDLTLKGSSFGFRRVLELLLENSEEAVVHQSSPWIRIEVDEGPAWLELKIVDSGENISSTITPYLMSPFFTTHAPLKRGMGLSLCARIVHDLGGEIFLDQKARHTTFVIRLPKAG